MLFTMTETDCLFFVDKLKNIVLSSFQTFTPTVDEIIARGSQPTFMKGENEIIGLEAKYVLAYYLILSSNGGH